MNHDDIIEKSAQVLSTFTTCDGQPHATELHRRQANALADAGLLARHLPTREEIAKAIADGWNSVTTLNVTTQSIGPTAAADAVLTLLKEQTNE